MGAEQQEREGVEQVQRRCLAEEMNLRRRVAMPAEHEHADGEHHIAPDQHRGEPDRDDSPRGERIQRREGNEARIDFEEVRNALPTKNPRNAF